MHYWKDNQGNIYGPFAKQKDGFPNAGEVVRYYRMKKGMSEDTLAATLHVTKKWVFNMETKNKVPELISRRQAIAKALEIPVVLFGLSEIGKNTYLAETGTSFIKQSSLSASSVELNDYLTVAWDHFTSTGSTDMLPNILHQKQQVQDIAMQSGPDQEKALRLLNRYEHFSLVVAREQQDYTLVNTQSLVETAEQLGDSELLGISLYRRGKLLADQHQLPEALKDIRAAIKHVQTATPLIKGFVLEGSGGVLATAATDQADVKEVLSLLDEAATYLDKPKNRPDELRIKFDRGRYARSRAEALLPLLPLDSSLIDEIYRALDVAEQHTGPHLVRRRAYIEQVYAQAAFQNGDVLGAIASASSSLELSRSVSLQRNIAIIESLYYQLEAIKGVKGSIDLRQLGKDLQTYKAHFSPNTAK